MTFILFLIRGSAFLMQNKADPTVIHKCNVTNFFCFTWIGDGSCQGRWKAVMVVRRSAIQLGWTVGHPHLMQGESCLNLARPSLLSNSRNGSIHP